MIRLFLALAIFITGLLSVDVSHAYTHPESSLLSFGAVPVGRSGEQLLVGGSGAFGSVAALQLVSGDTRDFRITEDRYSGVQPSSTRAAVIRFTPTRPGAKRATLRIRHVLALRGASLDQTEYVTLKGTAENGTQIPVRRLTQDGDVPWAKNRYGRSGSVTIGQKGCALTSLTMALNAAGLSLDPGTFNATLQKSGGYSGTSINWEPAVRVASKGMFRFKRAWLGSGAGGSGSAHRFLKNAIQQGHPVVVGVKFRGSAPGHFVLVTGYQPRDPGNPAAGDRFMIADPQFGDRVSLDDYNGRFVTRGYVAPTSSAAPALAAKPSDGQVPLPSAHSNDLSEQRNRMVSVNPGADLDFIDVPSSPNGNNPSAPSETGILLVNRGVDAGRRRQATDTTSQSVPMTLGFSSTAHPPDESFLPDPSPPDEKKFREALPPTYDEILLE